MFALIPIAILLGIVAIDRLSSAPRPAHHAPAFAAVGPMALPASAMSGRAPSPIAVLCVFLRANRQPPPMVVRCAIAEAELIGRKDLAYDLMRTFAIPAEYQVTQPASTARPPLAQAAPVTDNAPLSPPTQDDLTEESLPVAPFAPAPAAPAPQPQPQPQIDSEPTPITVNVASPIQGVPDDAWAYFCAQLVRESPAFASQRHVGRYRHRKDRLAEIGFDPDSLLGSADAQDAALTADLADAYKHLVASGLAKQHVGRPVSIPDVDGSIPITLSGLLGLASVAGLEGCAGWLERKPDRKKFPHTTQAFLRTNGIF